MQFSSDLWGRFVRCCCPDPYHCSCCRFPAFQIRAAAPDNVSHRTCEVISQRGVRQRRGGLMLVILQFLSDPLSCLRLSHSGSTHPKRWHVAAISREQPRGRQWQEEGLEQIELWHPPPLQVTLHCLLADDIWARPCRRTHTRDRYKTLKRSVFHISSGYHIHADKANSTLKVFIKKSPTFVGTSHPFQVICKCRLSPNQVGEYAHLYKEHRHDNTSEITR